MEVNGGQSVLRCFLSLRCTPQVVTDDGGGDRFLLTAIAFRSLLFYGDDPLAKISTVGSKPGPGLFPSME